MISLHLGHPWMRKTVRETSSYKELLRPLWEEQGSTYMMTQRKSLPTMRKQPEWEDPHLQDNKAIKIGHQTIPK